MAEAWSREEIELITADYLVMLMAEVRGERYNKAEHRRALMKQLNNRSDGSIEYKHQNISAVLLEHGFPPIDGYKPAFNYQGGIFPQIVLEQVAANTALRALIDKQVEQPESAVPSVEDLLAVQVDPPSPRDREPATTSREAPVFHDKIDYLAREARNRNLGRMGEHFALNFEKARLIAAGRDNLADRIEHVSAEQGDGAGFDIRSFEATGKDRLIEVKTTRYSRYAPFYLSSNELKVSTAEAQRYYLYRLFNFGGDTGLFQLKGRLEGQCRLDPTEYRVSV